MDIQIIKHELRKKNLYSQKPLKTLENQWIFIMDIKLILTQRALQQKRDIKFEIEFSFIIYKCQMKGIKKNCFEIFGIDFILDEDFKQWLIEPNKNSSLEVTNYWEVSSQDQQIMHLNQIKIEYFINKDFHKVSFSQLFKRRNLQEYVGQF